VATTHPGRLSADPTVENESGTTQLIDTEFANVYGDPRVVNPSIHAARRDSGRSYRRE
jgi:hypothetical protein